MSSHKKQLGIENLETRLNQSVVPIAVGWASSYYAALSARPKAPKGPIKPAMRPTVSSSIPSTHVATPVVKTPAKPATKPTPVANTPAIPSITTTHTVTQTTTQISTTPPVTTPTTTPATTPATTQTVTTTAPSVTAPIAATITTPANSPSTSNANSPATPSANTTPDPLAPILARLYGDDVHDDSGTIQQLIDVSNADGIKTVALPAGKFLLDEQINVYGTGLTFTGQGASTVLDVNHFHTGIDSTGKTGQGISVRAVFDSTPLMIAQPVTGNTIVFRGNVGLTAGQSLYLSDGLGSSAIIESQLHGALTQPGEFNELGPSEYVQVASVTQSGGNTVVTLTSNVIGSGEYANARPAGTTSLNYLHASTIQTATSDITLQNFAMKFKDPGADAAIVAKFTDHLTINGVQILNAPQHGGLGGIGVVSSTNALIENVTSANPIGLNSTRASTVTNCNVACITLEESCTDDLITRNTLTGTTSCDLRINDMALHAQHAQLQRRPWRGARTGAIAIAEGTDTTIANNIVHDGAASIWLGTTSGSKVIGNTAVAFGNYDPLGTTLVTGNSWLGG